MPNSPDPADVSDMLADDNAQQAQGLRASMYVATQGDPDQAAKDQGMAKKLGVPSLPAGASSDPDMDHAGKMADFNADKVAQETPKAAAALANPQMAAIAHDDVDTMQKVDKTVQGWQQTHDDTQGLMGWFRGVDQMYRDANAESMAALKGGVGAAIKSVADIPGAMLSANELMKSDMHGNLPPQDAQFDAGLRKLFAKNPMMRFATMISASAQNPDLLHDQTASVIDSWGTDKTLALRKLNNTVLGMGPYVVAELASMGEATLPMAIGAGASSEEEARDKGLTPGQSVLRGVGQGAIFFLAGKLSTMIPIKYMQSQLAPVFGKALADESVGSALQSTLKATFGQFYHAAVAGAGMKGLGALTDYASGYSQELPPDLGKQMLEEGVTFGLTGPIFGAATLGDVFHGQSEKVQEIATAKQHLLALDALTQQSKSEGKTAARSPEAWQTFLQENTEGSPAEHLYMHPDAFDEIAAKHGADPAATAADLGVERGYAEAKANGTDMQIPTSAVLAKLSGHPALEDFLNSVKTRPDGITMNDVENIRTEQRKAVRDAQNADDESAERVFQARKEEILKAGVPAGQADAEARLFSEFVKRGTEELRRNSGQEKATPEDFVQQMGLQERQPAQLGLLDRVKQAINLPVEAAPAAEVDQNGMTEQDRNAYEKWKKAENNRVLKATGGLSPVTDAVRKAGGMDVQTLKDTGMRGELQDINHVFGGHLSPDAALESIKQEGEFQHLETPGDMFEAIRNEMRAKAQAAWEKRVKLADYRAQEQGRKFEQAIEGPNEYVADRGKDVKMDSRPVPDEDEITQLRAERDKLLADLTQEKRLRRTNPLTGLMNLVAFDEAHAEDPFKRIAAFDLSNFKKYNDLLGHEGVDKGVFPELGKALMKAQHDLGLNLFHRSGDEFQIGFRNETPEQAKKQMDRLMTRLEKNLGLHLQGFDTDGNPARWAIEGVPAVYGIAEEYKNADNAAKQESNRRRALPPEHPEHLQDLRGPEHKNDIPRNFRRLDGADGAGAADAGDARAGVQPGGRAAATPDVTFEQKAKDVKGQISFAYAKSGDRASEFTATIDRFAKADVSTGIHELGHYMLESMRRLAAMPNASDQVKSDLARLEDFAGVNEGKWADSHHEKIARGLEKYVMEGKAPSLELRPVFDRLRTWMAKIYDSVKSIIGPQLEPDVRAVFDRMLAAPEQIKQAQADMGRAAWVNPVDDPKYAAAIQLAHEAAETDLLRRANRDIMRHQTAAWQDAAAAVEKDARPELAGQRNYKALAAFNGKDFEGQPLPEAERVKIDRAELKAKYGVTAIRGARGAVVREGGMHPDQAAEVLGYKDAAEMMAEMAQTKPYKAALKELVTDRTDLLHGPKPTITEVADQAVAAVHNVDSGKVLEMEQRRLLEQNPGVFKALMKKMAVLMPPTEDLYDQARRTIGGTAVKDVREGLYAAAETRARREAADLYAKGDIAGTFDAKRRERLNHELYRAAVDAKDAVDEGLDYLKKFSKAAVRSKIDLEYRDQIDSILDRYDLRKSVNPNAAKKPLADFIEGLAAQGHAPAVTDAMLNEALRTHYKNMPMQDFNDLVGGIKSLDDIGRMRKKVSDGDKKVALQAIADEAAQTMAGLKQRTPESDRGLGRMDKAWLQAKKFGRTAEGNLLKMEQMFDWLDDRNPLGALNRTVFRPIADAFGRRAELQLQIKASMDALDTKMKDATENAGQIFRADGLIDSETGQPQELTKKEILMLAGNMGNRSNIEKLCKGENWSEDEVWKFLNKNLNKDDWDFVHGLSKIFEDIYPQKLAMGRRLGNTDPERVTPAPFETATGDKYPGWYWPIVYDPARSQDVADRGAKKADALFENTYSRANTDTGRMNTRVQGYARPLLLSLDAIPRVMADEIHDIAMREAVMNADKVISHPQVRDGIVSALSQEHYDQIRPWLQAVANDGRGDPSTLKFLDRTARWGRTNATMVGLGLRVSTMLQHGATAGMESIAEVGPKWMAKGLTAFANPAAWAENKDFIFERSSMMKNRMNDSDRDIREQNEEIYKRSLDPATGAVQRGKDFITARAYQGIGMLDMASALPTWMGAYIRAMSPEGEGGHGMDEKDAVYFADKSVRNAHGGTTVADLAAIQRGSETQKLFTMYYSFWNHNINRIMDTGRMAADPETWKDSGRAGQVVMRTMAYVFGVQAIHAGIHAMMYGQDDKDKSAHWYTWAGKAFERSILGGIPVARDLEAYFSGESKDYSVTPAAALVASVHQSVVDGMNAWEGRHVNDQWLKHAITNGGYLTGLPTGQPASTAQFLWDVHTGKQDPQSVADWWHGITSGHANPKR